MACWWHVFIFSSCALSSPTICFTINRESLYTLRHQIPNSSTSSISLIRTLYSASLLEALKAKWMALSWITPPGDQMMNPAPIPLKLDALSIVSVYAPESPLSSFAKVNSVVKSTRIWPLMVVQGENLMWKFPIPVAHFIIFLNKSCSYKVTCIGRLL